MRGQTLQENPLSLRSYFQTLKKSGIFSRFIEENDRKLSSFQKTHQFPLAAYLNLTTTEAAGTGG